MLQAFLSGALLGLTSVPHCAVMCGPLAAATCARSTRRSAPLRYQLGRTLSYGLAGAVAGSASHVLLHAIEPGLLVFTLFAALAAGACLLVARLLVAPRRAAGDLIQLGDGPRRRSLSASLLRLAPSDPGAFGMLSVLLPCGVLGAALLVAIASGDARSGAAAMTGFATTSGLALLAAGALARTLPLRASPVVRRWVALALVVAALGLMIEPVHALVRAPRQHSGAQVRHCHR
jgi:sulfite exporter TauE/SafE